MHSTIATVLLAAAASLSNAAALKRGSTSSQTECQGKGAYYVCSNNNFRGYCSVDPCDKRWCTDFEDGTCYSRYPHHGQYNTTISVTTVTVTSTLTTTTCTETTTPMPVHTACSSSATSYYVCANNQFRGYCSSDPCAKEWCPDYEPRTYQCTKEVKPEKPTDCHHCGSHSSSTSTSSCTSETTPTVPPTPCSTHIVESTTTPCTTPTPVVTDTCPNGTGYYQVCSNGFRGCCQQDACAGAKPICPGKEVKPITYTA
jgi:hypothetical protein